MTTDCELQRPIKKKNLWVLPVDFMDKLQNQYLNEKRTVADLARIYSIPVMTIKTWLLNIGIKLRNHREAFGKISTIQIKEIINLYHEGYSTWEIAPKFGVLNVCI